MSGLITQPAIDGTGDPVHANAVTGFDTDLGNVGDDGTEGFLYCHAAMATRNRCTPAGFLKHQIEYREVSWPGGQITSPEGRGVLSGCSSQLIDETLDDKSSIGMTD